MSAKSQLENKIRVKQAQVDKFERLAGVAGSLPKRNTWNFHAKRFRAQVGVLKNTLEQLGRRSS